MFRQRKDIDLKSATKAAVRYEIRLLQSRAREYFYAYDKKQNILLSTSTLHKMHDFIVDHYKLSNKQASLLAKGIKLQVENELIASVGVKNIKKVGQEFPHIYYKIRMINADFNKVPRKKRTDNLIKQQKENVMITVQLDKDLREAVKDYCTTRGITLSSLVRNHFINLLEQELGN